MREWILTLPLFLCQNRENEVWDMADRGSKVKGFYMERHNFSKEVKDNEELFLRLEGAKGQEREDIITELLENNMRGVHVVIRRKFKGTAVHICQGYRMTFDELFSVGYEALLSAIKTFDVHRGFKFTTYYYKCIHYYYNKFFERIKIDAGDISMDATVHESNSNVDDKDLTMSHMLRRDEDIAQVVADNSYISSMVSELEKEFKPKYMNVFKANMDGLYTQMELAEQFGMSQAHISRIVRKVQKRAREIRDEWEGVIL
jgi:RNA polymerase sigma factor (sigma-70 family)